MINRQNQHNNNKYNTFLTLSFLLVILVNAQLFKSSCLCLTPAESSRLAATIRKNTSDEGGGGGFSTDFLIHRTNFFTPINLLINNNFEKNKNIHNSSRENLNQRKNEPQEDTTRRTINNEDFNGSADDDLVSVQIKISDIPQEFVSLFGKKENISDSFGNALPTVKYMGVPFALAPTNNFRFQRPTLLTLGKNFAAVQEPPPCPQLLSTGEQIGDESCLFLNIYIPDESSKNETDQEQLEKMPVLIWYHGESLSRLLDDQLFGVLTSGSASDLNPDVFLQNKIIVVTPQYRIGSLGFLSTNNEDLNGNMGIFDQLLALEWVHKFISSFGGDPKQVTLMGHGGSAMSLGLLATSELARGLFHRLILMSGSPLSPVAVDSTPKTTFAEIALRNSCPSFPTLRFVRCMQRRSVSSLLQSDLQLSNGKNLGNTKSPLPIIQRNPDGRFLPPIISSHPKTAFLTGNFEQVPLILGVNLAEMAGFLPVLSGKSMKEIPSTIFASESSLKQFLRSVMTRDSLDPDLSAEMVSFEYFSGLNVTKREEQAKDVLEEVLTDFMFHIPALNLATMWSKFAPVYFYVFNYVRASGPESEKITKAGKQVQAANQALHGGDLNFLMTGYKGTAPDRQISDPMVEYWINFIHKGSPLNSGIDWPQFREDSREFVMFGDQVEVSKGFRARQNYFWVTLLQDLNSRECAGSVKRRIGSGRNSVVTFRDPEDFLKYTAGFTRSRKVVSEAPPATA